MSLSPETLELVLRGLGQQPLAEGEVIWSRTHSWPTLAAACKAKLRERGISLSTYCGKKGSSATISTTTAVPRRPVMRNVYGTARAETDDEAVILAFAAAVKAGAL